MHCEHNHLGALHSLEAVGHVGVLIERLMLAVCWVSNTIGDRVTTLTPALPKSGADLSGTNDGDLHPCSPVKQANHIRADTVGDLREKRQQYRHEAVEASELHVEQEVHHVAVLYDVFFTFDSEFTCGL